MTVMLRTACGCTKYAEWGSELHLGSILVVPTNFAEDNIASILLAKYKTLFVRRNRSFQFRGFFEQRMPIFEEMK